MRSLRVTCCSNNATFKERVKQAVQSIDQKRTVLERARRERFTRLADDWRSIVKREVDYSKQLVEEIVPVKVEINEDVVTMLKALSPIRIVFTSSDDSSSDTSDE